MSGSADRLVRMANQIAREFEHQQGANAAHATWNHLWHFWDPRMRAAIVAAEASGAPGLSDTAVAAVRRLASGAEPAPQTRATEFATDPNEVTEADAG